ncbi:neural-cadherin-like [Penaeus monodon]|uniref:neural-cadherin-like n=1 Tax=Penaeus monodon TaxID=6687 RepID=UPI0018A76E59|nr:neural-cadherin-like [Penaeus monodon]
MTAEFLHYLPLESFSPTVLEYRAGGLGPLRVEGSGGAGPLVCSKALDYERYSPGRGFKFMVQVLTEWGFDWGELGPGGWHEPATWTPRGFAGPLEGHQRQRPALHTPAAHVTVREDASPGTLLATLAAHDPDMDGRQQVDYRVLGGWGALSVDSGGDVSLWRALDREAPDGAVGVANLIAVDRGRPPLTSTATITITVADINDCPPRLLPPTTFHVPENAPPTLLGVLTATDDDVWAMGHGPPFVLSLAPSNPSFVFAQVALKFLPTQDSGRGGAELRTLGGLDREEHRQLQVAVKVADAGGLSAVETVTIVIDDVNDNPMLPAAKTVYLWKTQSGGSDIPLGRVYVEDPDDWDVGDKSFAWLTAPQPPFILNSNTGNIFVSSQVREGRYELHFAVSDRVWRQERVEANVTVEVRVLTPDALAHAAPLTLSPSTPAQFTRGWTPKTGGGGLGRLVQAVRKALGDPALDVEVVSVYGDDGAPSAAFSALHPPSPNSLVAGPGGQMASPVTVAAPAWTCVWVGVRKGPLDYMDPVKLHGLLDLHTPQLVEATNLTVTVGMPEPSPGHREGVGVIPAPPSPAPDRLPPQGPSPSYLDGGRDPSSAASRPSKTLALQVVDTNATSLVTPRLAFTSECLAPESEDCTDSPCLNGGRCVKLSTGQRCVCPGGSWGPRCKVLARTFTASGWAWVRHLPSCLPTTISFRILTRSPDALVLYSGPLTPVPRRPGSLPSPMIAVQVVGGRPQVLLEGVGESVKVEVKAIVNDGYWHTVHVLVDTQGVALMVDLCGRGFEESPKDDSHCVVRASWANKRSSEAWAWAGPLQVAGLAQEVMHPEDFGWSVTPTTQPLKGCISHLTLNGQLVDLGEPPYSQGSTAGCQPQETACGSKRGSCGLRGECVGGLERPECECEPGWAGPECGVPTVPASLGSSSCMKMALSFTPGPRVVKMQLRVRSRGARDGLLLHLAAQQRNTGLTLRLRAGVACASMSGAGWAMRTVCVDGRSLGDGAWHTLKVERHAHNLLVSVDDGDGWRKNESLPSLTAPMIGGGWAGGPSQGVEILDGVTLGCLPGDVSGDVNSDLSDTCVDDIRVSGRLLPLAPAVNATSWGQVDSWDQLESGCPSPASCVNTTCVPPLTCHTTWDHASCSCGPGSQLVGRSCEDVNECLWEPCLHGGTCTNLRPGYLCACGPGHAGDNCQWSRAVAVAHPLTAPAAILAVTVSLFVLVVLGVVFSLRRRRLRGRRNAGDGDCKKSCQRGTMVALKGKAVDGGKGVVADVIYETFS